MSNEDVGDNSNAELGLNGSPTIEAHDKKPLIYLDKKSLEPFQKRGKFCLIRWFMFVGVCLGWIALAAIIVFKIIKTKDNLEVS
uniref:Uncharacterized protein n=1 Tax=Panagrolaimus sp. JU765 TaxID=591449 RepID=A0AC34RF82_9BILA